MQGVTGRNHNPQIDRELMADVRHVNELDAIDTDCCDFVIHLAAAIRSARIGCPYVCSFCTRTN